MGDKPQIINGNLILPVGQSVGFGTSTDPQILEATGPQIHSVSADPNGSLVAPIGSLALRSDSATLYQNTDGLSAWSEVGGAGGDLVLKQRIELADLPAALTTTVFFADQIPANRPIIAVLPFINAAPTGGGVTTCTLTCQTDAPPGNILFDAGQGVGFPSPDFWNVVRDGSTVYSPRVDPSLYDVTAAARNAAFTVIADVNLDTLATFDATMIIVIGPALTAP
jgi:hypothetical protein